MYDCSYTQASMFDLEQHVLHKFPLEVVINEAGEVAYCVPDAFQYLVGKVALLEGSSCDEVVQKVLGDGAYIPGTITDAMCDAIQYMCAMLNLVYMTEKGIIYNQVTRGQFCTIKQLQDVGLYAGELPNMRDIL